MRACPDCKKESVLDDGYCGQCRQCTLSPSLAAPTGSPFRALTVQGLRTLIQRLDDVDGSVLTTMETARYASEMELFGKLSMTATTILAIRERYKAILEGMENESSSWMPERKR